MNKLHLGVLAASIAVASAAWAGGNHQSPPNSSHAGASSVVLRGTTTATALGDRVSTYGRVTVDGTFATQNGTTHFQGDSGAMSNGAFYSDSQTDLRLQAGYSRNSVSNRGVMESGAFSLGQSRSATAWGDMSVHGNLRGPSGSDVNFGVNHGYDAVSSDHAMGYSRGNFAANFSPVQGGNHHGGYGSGHGH